MSSDGQRDVCVVPEHPTPDITDWPLREDAEASMPNSNVVCERQSVYAPEYLCRLRTVDQSVFVSIVWNVSL